MAAIAPVVLSGPAWPDGGGYQPTFRMDYYDVSGKTWREIWDSIKSNLQKEKDLQGRYEGVTSYSARLGPDSLVDSDTCSSDTATLSVELVVKVPRLTTRILPAQDQECWAFYDRSLSDHEEWHVQIAVHDLQSLMEKIRSTPGMSCKAIGQLARQEAKKMIDEENTYDAVTSHGMEQWKAFGLDKPRESDYVAGVRNRCFG